MQLLNKSILYALQLVEVDAQCLMSVKEDAQEEHPYQMVAVSAQWVKH
jgi:hypothetical protein